MILSGETITFTEDELRSAPDPVRLTFAPDADLPPPILAAEYPAANLFDAITDCTTALVVQQCAGKDIEAAAEQAPGADYSVWHKVLLKKCLVLEKAFRQLVNIQNGEDPDALQQPLAEVIYLPSDWHVGAAPGDEDAEVIDFPATTEVQPLSAKADLQLIVNGSPDPGLETARPIQLPLLHSIRFDQ